MLSAVAEQEKDHENVRVVLWGQSIGAGVAADALARYLRQRSEERRLDIRGLILETPFVSIRLMLTTLYPQRWLPYRYLWPFLTNHWDNKTALATIQTHSKDKPVNVLIMQAGADELVSDEHSMILEEHCKDLGFNVERYTAPGALHATAIAQRGSRQAIAAFVKHVFEEKPPEK